MCTRLSACGSAESGACVTPCVRTSDCLGGLTCKGGLCTNAPSSDGDPGSDDNVEGLPGTVSAGADGAWARTFPGLSSTAPEIALGPGGDLVVKVKSARLPVISSNRYLSDDWLIRLDGATGATKWIEKVPDNGKMAVDVDGNIVLAWPRLLQKLGPDGSLLWAREREPAANRGVVPDYELVRAAMDGEGNILIARIELDEAPEVIGGNSVGFVTLEKLDPDGNPLFVHRFGDGTTMLDGAYVIADASNNVVFLTSVVEGSVDFGGGAREGYNVLAKYDAQGQHLFSKSIGGYGLRGYLPSSPLQTTPEGNIFFRNESVGPIDIGLGEIECFRYLFEFDGAGAPLANYCSHVENLAVLPQGGFVITSTLFEATTVSGEPCVPNMDDGLVARYDGAGVLLGKYCGSDPGNQVFAAVLSASPDMLFLAGAFGGVLTLPGGMVLSPAAPNASTAMVAKIPPP